MKTVCQYCSGTKRIATLHANIPCYLCDDEYFTDTERLDWMVLNHARPAQKPNGLWACKIIKLNGYRSIGDFVTYREAIDAAMEEK